MKKEATVTTRLRQGLFATTALLVAGLGCGSNGNPVDTRPLYQRSDASLSPAPTVEAGSPASGIDDGGSEAGPAGVSLGIINPGDGRGGGTVVTRQLPVSYASCKAH